jgi:hypothetical protein
MPKNQGNFTKVSNRLINSNSLSLAAKGLFVYLQSKPPGWCFSAEKISWQIKEKKKAVARVLIELESLGLLKRKSLKNDDNKFIGISYSILTNQELAVYPILGERERGKPKQGKYSNTVNSKTDYSKKEYMGVFFKNPVIVSFLEGEADQEGCIEWFNQLIGEVWFERKPKPLPLTDKNLRMLVDNLDHESGWEYYEDRMGSTQYFPLQAIQEAKSRKG